MRNSDTFAKYKNTFSGVCICNNAELLQIFLVTFEFIWLPNRAFLVLLLTFHFLQLQAHTHAHRRRCMANATLRPANVMKYNKNNNGNNICQITLTTCGDMNVCELFNGNKKAKSPARLASAEVASSVVANIFTWKLPGSVRCTRTIYFYYHFSYWHVCRISAVHLHKPRPSKGVSRLRRSLLSIVWYR